MLLVEPAELEDVGGFVDAVERYSDGALWVYESAGSPCLRTAKAAEIIALRNESDKPQPAAAPAAGTAQAPKLKLSGEGALPPERSAEVEADTPSPVPDVKFRSVAPSGGVKPPTVTAAPVAPTMPPGPRAQTLLTDEELAMLLAFEPEKRTS